MRLATKAFVERDAAEDIVDDSRTALETEFVGRAFSQGTRSRDEAVPAWVLVLLIALPVSAGWFVARSLAPDLSWVRASVGAGANSSHGQVASVRSVEIPVASSHAEHAEDIRPSVSGPAPITVADSLPATADLVTPGPAESARVVHTEGLGVVLRTAPREEARVPRGLLEGARVTVLEQPDSEWVLVRAENGLEGWMPVKYLAVSE